MQPAGESASSVLGEGTVKRLLLASTLAVALVGLGPREADAQTYTAFLNGEQEVPPVETMARSVAVFSFLFNDAILYGFRFNFFFAGEDVDMVHIHEAPPGVDGPIVLNLRPDGFCVDFGQFLTVYIATARQLRGSLEGKSMRDLRHLMDDGNTYLNLHTPEFPGGWIRGHFATTPMPAPTPSRR
jgi:hypothetical protein